MSKDPSLNRQAEIDVAKRAAGGSQPKASQGYEVKVFAAKYRLTADQARQLIGEVGNDRDLLDAAAAKFKKR